MCKLLQLAGAAYKLVRAATCIAGVGRALTCIDLVNTSTRYAALRPTITAALFILTPRPAAEKSLEFGLTRLIMSLKNGGEWGQRVIPRTL